MISLKYLGSPLEIQMTELERNTCAKLAEALGLSKECKMDLVGLALNAGIRIRRLESELRSIINEPKKGA
jgi:hypothetical protein